MKEFIVMVCTMCCFISAAYAGNIDNRISKAMEGVERNTSRAVDAITLLARGDAKEISEKLEKDAILFLRDNYPHYHKDDATMEKTMYYGSLLDKAYKDERGQLGWAALKAVKYVYRGHQKVGDDATQNSLRRVEKALKRLEP